MAVDSPIFATLEFADVQIRNGLGDSESVQQFVADVKGAIESAPMMTLQSAIQVVKAIGSSKFDADSRKMLSKVVNSKTLRPGQVAGGPAASHAAGPSQPAQVQPARETSQCGQPGHASVAAHRDEAAQVPPAAPPLHPPVPRAGEAGAAQWAADIVSAPRADTVGQPNQLQISQLGRAARRRLRSTTGKSRQELQDCDWFHRYMTEDMWKAFLSPSVTWEKCLELLVQRCTLMGLTHPSEPTALGMWITFAVCRAVPGAMGSSPVFDQELGVMRKQEIMSTIASYRLVYRDQFSGFVKQFPETPDQFKALHPEIYARCFNETMKECACQVDERAIMFLKGQMSCRWSNKRISQASATRGRRAVVSVRANFQSTSMEEPIPGLRVFDRPQPAAQTDCGALPLGGGPQSSALPLSNVPLPLTTAIVPGQLVDNQGLSLQK